MFSLPPLSSGFSFWTLLCHFTTLQTLLHYHISYYKSLLSIFCYSILSSGYAIENRYSEIFCQCFMIYFLKRWILCHKLENLIGFLEYEHSQQPMTTYYIGNMKKLYLKLYRTKNSKTSLSMILYNSELAQALKIIAVLLSMCTS